MLNMKKSVSRYIGIALLMLVSYTFLFYEDDPDLDFSAIKSVKISNCDIDYFGRARKSVVCDVSVNKELPDTYIIKSSSFTSNGAFISNSILEVKAEKLIEYKVIRQKLLDYYSSEGVSAIKFIEQI